MDPGSLIRTFGIGFVWAFDPINKHWWRFGQWSANVHGDDDELGPLARRGHKAYVHDYKMVIVGGFNDLFTSSPLWSNSTIPVSAIMKPCWIFDLGYEGWEPLDHADIPIESVPFCSAMSGTIIYLLEHTEFGGMKIHVMDISAKEPSWTTVKHYTSRMDDQLPASRTGASLVPISDSTGQRYLLYMFGQKQAPFEPSGQGSCWAILDGKDLTRLEDYTFDIWALRLPSDPISGEYKWINLPMKPGRGSRLPQPLSGQACEALWDRSVILWGGKPLPGDQSNLPRAVGDGWIITLDFYTKVSDASEINAAEFKTWMNNSKESSTNEREQQPTLTLLIEYREDLAVLAAYGISKFDLRLTKYMH